MKSFHTGKMNISCLNSRQNLILDDIYNYTWNLEKRLEKEGNADFGHVVQFTLDNTNGLLDIVINTTYRHKSDRKYSRSCITEQYTLGFCQTIHLCRTIENFVSFLNKELDYDYFIRIRDVKRNND